MPAERRTPNIPGHDEHGVAFTQYPGCEHQFDERDDPSGNCSLCVPTAVREQRLIDGDPHGYDEAVEAMLAAYEESIHHRAGRRTHSLRRPWIGGNR